MSFTKHPPPVSSKPDTAKSSQEIWLGGIIDNFIMGLTSAELSPDNVLKLQVVHEATKLLGLQNLADETATKLASLQARLAAGEQSDHLAINAANS